LKATGFKVVSHPSAFLVSQAFAFITALHPLHVGPDRPGLVCALTKAVLDARGSVEESRMARLGGRGGVGTLFFTT
jgi:glycine cleavage system regulatory protein